MGQTLNAKKEVRQPPSAGKAHSATSPAASRVAELGSATRPRSTGGGVRKGPVPLRLRPQATCRRRRVSPSRTKSTRQAHRSRHPVATEHAVRSTKPKSGAISGTVWRKVSDPVHSRGHRRRRRALRRHAPGRPARSGSARAGRGSGARRRDDQPQGRQAHPRHRKLSRRDGRTLKNCAAGRPAKTRENQPGSARRSIKAQQASRWPTSPTSFSQRPNVGGAHRADHQREQPRHASRLHRQGFAEKARRGPCLSARPQSIEDESAGPVNRCVGTEELSTVSIIDEMIGGAEAVMWSEPISGNVKNGDAGTRLTEKHRPAFCARSGRSTHFGLVCRYENISRLTHAHCRRHGARQMPLEAI